MQRWNLPEGWVISKHPAHPALVSEAGFFAHRRPLSRAARPDRPRGGTCWPGCWPARGAGGGWNRPGPTASPPTGAAHGYTSATGPAPARPKNTYVREDQILPHLAAIAILLRGGQAAGHASAQVTVPAEAADLIDQLRGSGTVLTYDPDTHTIRSGEGGLIAVTAS